MAREKLDPAKLRAIEEAARIAVQSRAERLMRRKRADEKREQRRVRAGLGASFLEPGASSTPPQGGAYTVQAPAGVADTPTSLPPFLPPPDPDTRPMEVVWSPQPGPQYHFIHCPVTDVVFGGSRGGGKSDALIGDAAIRAGKYGSGFRGLFLRRQQVELADIKMRMQAVYGPIGAKWSEQHQTWTYPGGGTLVLKYLANDDDALLYKGWSISALYVDEIGDFPSRRPIDLLWGAMRSASGVPIVRRMSCNPGGAGHCLPFGDVLTPLGWVDISTMKVGDAVYTVTAAGEMVEARVAQTHSSWYDGEMIDVSARGLRMVCTPNHRVAKVGGNGKNPDGTNINRKKHEAPAFSLVPFEKLPGQATVLRSVSWGVGGDAGVPVEIPRLPGRRKHAQPLALPRLRYAALLGWFLSEGCVVPRDKAFSIAQEKAAGRDAIRSLLTECGFVFSEAPSQFTVYSPEWYEHLRQFGKSRQKFVPAWLKSSGVAVLDSFLRAAMAGDGHWQSIGSGAYYTISGRLADDFAEIALKLGYIVHQSSRQRPNRDGLHYSVSIKRTRSGGTEILTGQSVYRRGKGTKRRSDVRRIPYSGPVYCIGVEGTHSFVVRQNGSVWVSGNSWVRQTYLSNGPYKVFKHTPNPDLPDDAIDAVFIPSKLEDNKILMKNDPRYEARIAASVGGDKALWRAWRYGDWDVLAGTYFSFDEGKNVGMPPPMPDYMPRWMSIDWGYTHQTAALWAIDLGERAYVYRERGYTGTDPVSLGMYLAEVNGDERVQNVYLSPDAFAHRSGENTVASDLYDGFRRAHEMRGCALLPAPEPAFNDRVNGWQSVASGLQHGRLMISPSCSELIRTLPAMVRDPKKPNDIQKVDGDDFVDSLRYLWATRRRGEVFEPIEVRASREITAEDPNHRAMQERLFLAREAGGAGEPGGVILRGRMRPSRYFE